MFIVFVVVNNGIVVGDRTNHKATFHLVQIFYFLGFSMFFSLSTFVFNYKTVKGLTQFIGKNYKVILAVLLPVCCLIVKNFSFEHRFLLADNRHFTFYIWSKFMRKYEFARYVVVPFYVTAAYLFYRNLVSNGKSLGWLIAYFVCTLTCLVPQELIEFRYFILPYFIYRLNIVKLGWLEATFEVAFNALINFLTIYVFLNKTFVWTDSPEQLQRFMW
jgi:alpha-1,2-glucosyltransferase